MLPAQAWLSRYDGSCTASRRGGVASYIGRYKAYPSPAGGAAVGGSDPSGARDPGVRKVGGELSFTLTGNLRPSTRTDS